MTEGTLPPASEWSVLERIARAPGGVMDDLTVYRNVFHGTAKQTMWTLHLLFAGQVHDFKTGDTSSSLYLPYRITGEQREQAKEAFSILWGVISKATLEQTPVAAAKCDSAFQRFLAAARRAPAKRKPRRSP